MEILSLADSGNLRFVVVLFFFSHPMSKCFLFFPPHYMYLHFKHLYFIYQLFFQVTCNIV